MIAIKWKTLLIRVFFWLIMEIFLTYLGLDNLADYGEFVKQKESTFLLILCPLQDSNSYPDSIIGNTNFPK